MKEIASLTARAEKYLKSARILVADDDYDESAIYVRRTTHCCAQNEFCDLRSEV